MSFRIRFQGSRDLAALVVADQEAEALVKNMRISNLTDWVASQEQMNIRLHGTFPLFQKESLIADIQEVADVLLANPENAPLQGTGIGFTYLLKGLDGQIKFIFKPSEGEPGHEHCMARFGIHGLVEREKWGIEPGQGAIREAVARILGQDAGVMEVATVTLQHPSFLGGVQRQRGALIRYLHGAQTIKEFQELGGSLSSLPLREIQKLALFSMQVWNADCNRGNALIAQDQTIKPIDHGCIAPENFESPGHFCWMTEEALLDPFLPEFKERIRELNFEEDKAKILADFPDYPAGSLETIRVAYLILKYGDAFNLPVFDIASLFLEERLNKESEIQDYCIPRLLHFKADGNLEQMDLFILRMVAKVKECTGEFKGLSLIKRRDSIYSLLSGSIEEITG